MNYLLTANSIKRLKILSPLLVIILFIGCVGNMNPTGGHTQPNYPYYMMEMPGVVKNLKLPKGTKLTYKAQLFKKGKQNNPLNDQLIQTITLPPDQPILWAGVPIYRIDKFFNDEMKGYTLYANFKSLKEEEMSKFAALWSTTSMEMGISVVNIDDWSANKKNIADIESCGVNYQRYFANDKNQQQYLDLLFSELHKIIN